MRIVSVYDYPELLDEMAVWFSKKWGIPLDAYKESMKEC
jgi:hypothetical protein